MCIRDSDTAFDPVIRKYGSVIYRKFLSVPGGPPVFQFMGESARRSLRRQALRPSEGQSLSMPASAPGGNRGHHVPYDEPGCVYSLSDYPGRSANCPASCHMDRHVAEEFPHGIFLEHVRRSALYSLAFRENIPPRLSRRNFSWPDCSP